MIRCAIAQFAATADKAANLKVISSQVAEAAALGAGLVVFPENAMYYNSDKEVDIRPDTESVDGDFATTLSGLARDHSIAIVAGMTERPSEGAERCTNAVVVFDALGTSIGVYRKVHLYDAFGYKESQRVEPHPPEALVFELGGLRFGVMTCYDLRFPEMARFLVDSGADVLVVPAAWVAGPMKEFHWQTLALARAIENTTYLLACGQTGPISAGQSVIVDPMGVTLAGGGDEPSVSVATLTKERVEQVRLTNPSLANRRFAVSPR